MMLSFEQQRDRVILQKNKKNCASGVHFKKVLGCFHYDFDILPM